MFNLLAKFQGCTRELMLGYNEKKSTQTSGWLLNRNRKNCECGGGSFWSATTVVPCRNSCAPLFVLPLSGTSPSPSLGGGGGCTARAERRAFLLHLSAYLSVYVIMHVCLYTYIPRAIKPVLQCASSWSLRVHHLLVGVDHLLIRDEMATCQSSLAAFSSMCTPVSASASMCTGRVHTHECASIRRTHARLVPAPARTLSLPPSRIPCDCVPWVWVHVYLTV